MVTPKDVIGRDDILVALRPADKPALLRLLAPHVAARVNCDAEALFAATLKREDLGSTGIGDGVAIPHARVPQVRRPAAVLATLARPIDFQAIDGQPVDLVILLALPEALGGEALQVLSGMARCLHKPETRTSLRQAKDADTVHAILRSVA